MNKKLLSAVPTMLCLSMPIQANSIETLNVTGARIAHQGMVNSVISREDIDKLNPATMMDLLRQIPNVLIAENGQAGGHSFVSIRGGEPNFTLVLIDGVSVNDPTNSRGGGFDFNQLDPAVIERIEVYRGGVSAIYGTEAISGVIHIITRQAGVNQVSIAAGSQKQRQASITLSKTWNENLESLLSVSSNQQESSSFAQYHNRQAMFKMSGDYENADYTLLLSASSQDAKAFSEDSGGDLYANPRAAENRNSEEHLIGFNGQWNIADTLDWVGKLSWSQHQEMSVHPGIASAVLDGIPASQIESTFRKAEIESYFHWRPSNQWKLLMGVNAKQSKGTNEGTLDFGFPLEASFLLEQSLYSGFGEVSWSDSRSQLSMGLRYDDPENFDSKLSGRVSLSHSLTDSLQLFSIYSEGYKLPSFFALAHPLIGNPLLKPERSKNLELGGQFTDSAGMRVEIVYFNNEFSDLVDFDPERFTSVNRSEVKTQGLEFNGALPITDWLNLSLDASYLRVELEESAAPLRRRPKWFGGLSLDFYGQSWNILASANARSKYHDSSVATGLIELAGYSKWNLSGHWYYSEDLTLNLSVDNMTDKDYQESVGFTDNGLKWRAGFTYAF